MLSFSNFKVIYLFRAGFKLGFSLGRPISVPNLKLDFCLRHLPETSRSKDFLSILVSIHCHPYSCHYHLYHSVIGWLFSMMLLHFFFSYIISQACFILTFETPQFVIIEAVLVLLLITVNHFQLFFHIILINNSSKFLKQSYLHSPPPSWHQLQKTVLLEYGTWTPHMRSNHVQSSAVAKMVIKTEFSPSYVWSFYCASCLD